MSLRKKTVLLLYGINALISVILGSVYLFKDSFMSYHQVALGISWTNLEPSLRVLIGALMDVAGAGWIAVGVATAVLILGPLRDGERWSRFLVPVLLMIFYVPTLYATLVVMAETPATPPWYGNATSCLTVLLGFLIDSPWRA